MYLFRHDGALIEGRLQPVASPAGPPISLAQAAYALRIDAPGEDESAFLTARIGTAVDLLTGPGGYASRQLVTASWRLERPCFPCGSDPLVLPLPPLRTVTSVQYLDTDGVLQTWAAAKYSVERTVPEAGVPYPADTPPGQIRPAYGETYPTTRWQADAVRVTFDCGYGAPADVPGIFVAALLLVVGELYARREDSAVGQVATVPLAAQAILKDLRVARELGT